MLLYKPGCAFTASGRLSHRSGLNVERRAPKGKKRKRKVSDGPHKAHPRALGIAGSSFPL